MISSLNLCKEHKQEWKQSEYASHNCDYCKATWEIKKLQHQLEIQTKRVENLSEGLKRAKQDIVFLKKFADCPYPERYRCRCEYCQDRKHMQAESELNSCQAIDQELEKQLEGKC